MRPHWILLSLALSAALVGLAGWQWGWGGLGLTLAALASAGIALLARLRLQPAADQPGASLWASSGVRSTVLASQPLATDLAAHHALQAQQLELTRWLAEEAYGADSLTSALRRIGEALHHHLGASQWVCLRVEDWNGDSALVRPWVDTSREAVDLIDISTMLPVPHTEHPLGQTLMTLRPAAAELAPDAPARPWRAPQTQRVLALPVVFNGRVIALLEFSEPHMSLEAALPVLDVAAIQLGFVAHREASQAYLATSAEHLSRLALVANRINSGVAITDRHGVIEWVNEAFTALTGWTPTKVLGRPLSEVMAEESVQPDTVVELKTRLAEGGPFRLDYEATRPGQDGKEGHARYWSEIDALQMLDEGGGRSQYVCLFNDITRRKQQEHVREQEREFLEALLGNLPVSLFVLDPVTLNVVAINRYTEIEFGLQRDKVVGHSIEQALGNHVLELALPAMQQAVASGETVEHDFCWGRGDKARTVNARHFALRHANGQPRLLLSLARDVTSSRRAQSDLEESERRFRELVESMDDAVYVATQSREQYLYLSPRTEALLGLDHTAMREEPARVRGLIVPEDLPLLEAQEDMEKAGHATDTLLRLQVPGRGLRWIRHRTRTRHLSEGESRIYGLVSDVTDEHMQALELQRARDMAEAASQAKSQFMANMSHEIRTPMNGILGMTELLLGTALNDKQRRFAQAVYRSGESLLEIINDILDFAKIEAGRLELATSDFVLRTLVEDTLELMAPRAHEKGLELSFREQPGLPIVVHGDPLRLRQILTNLVANAIKFTEHGEVVVDIRRASVAHPDGMSGLELEFIVRDTGIGIPSDVLPRLFSAFVQANGGMARRYGGTGLGLAISKQLVELMGGQIAAHSAPGVGSEFVFRIPVTVGATQIDMAMVEEPAMPPMHVLVVDDNDTNRTVIENMLSAWGMTVTQATNGREALDILMADPAQDAGFDLALVDMNMPELDGLALADAVHASGRYPQLKMILLSSVSSPDDVRRAQDAGFQRFVAKPLRKGELRQAILGVSAELGGSQAELPRFNKQVLVVEDNPVNQEVCGQMLRRLGCEVRVASSALEGLRRLGEHRYDLVLMDIQMPGMDGIEALTWFRRGSGRRFNFLTPPDTPVVAVTANALEGDEQRFLSLGFDGYLSKPFRQSQLQKVLVEHTLQGTQPPSPSGDSGASDVVSTSESMHMSTQHNNDDAPASPSVSHAPDSAQVLDAEALQRLRELDPKGENHLISRVSQAFETSVSRLIPQLEDAARVNDTAAILHVAHTLKSSSASIGALKLSQMCAEIESMIRRQTGAGLSSRIEELPAEIQRALAALKQLPETRA